MNTKRGIALGLGAYFVAVNVWACLVFFPLSFRTCDFRQFYAGAYIFRYGEKARIYDFDYQTQIENARVSEGHAVAFVSPAYEAIAMWPLAGLSYRTAFIIFTVISFLLLAGCSFLLAPWSSELKRIYPWLPVAVICGFIPVGGALVNGQDSILLLTLITCSFVLLGKGREQLAGAVLACALFKFQIVIPIAVLFLLWRRWAFLKGFSVVALVLAVVSIASTGLDASKLYVESLLSIASLNRSAHGMSQGEVFWYMMPNINGFIFGLFRGILSTAWIKAVTVALSAALLIFAAKAGRKISDPQKLLALAVPCAVLLGYHTYMHDLSVLLLPTFVLLESNPKMGLALFVAPLIENVSTSLIYLIALAIIAAIYTVSAPLRSRTSCEGSSQPPLSPSNLALACRE